MMIINVNNNMNQNQIRRKKIKVEEGMFIINFNPNKIKF